ncbi:MAG TPA: non-homologous end-joining DNA ligase [Candidatus Saccharimonadales bacterium]|nr:non-homologous end-joining DNA ligase [Candidatus Saccharimonadales bacterium]
MSLLRYKEKRNFQRTPEPAGAKPLPKSKQLAFVIQKHAARTLHYDFRLEMEGVLKSWAVPKGIPTKKADRRLAMHVEDHPLEYGTFEGNIPEGNYGAGSVMLWDAGSYSMLDPDPVRAYRNGKIRFLLSGKKLTGEWTLVRMRGRQQPGKDPWLLIKSGEDIPDVSAKKDNESVITGNSMDQIAKSKGRVWKSDRSASTPKAPPSPNLPKSPNPASARPAKPLKAPTQVLKDLPRRAVQFVPPMKALLLESVPSQGNWVYEIKWDGYRALALKSRGKVRLVSRRANDVTLAFSEIAKAMERLKIKEATFDGEVVALDEHGHASFQLLQNSRRNSGQPVTLVYYIFDILNFEGKDVTGLSLLDRKALLEKILQGVPDPLRYSAHLEGDPHVLLAEVQKNHIEGLIAKRTDSVYEPDRRSGAWLKIKTALEQEFVIGGYTQPRGSRGYFGSILLGYYQDGQLLFASKAGTGFNHKSLRELYKTFQKLRTNKPAFINVPASRKSKWGEGLTAAEMKRCTWLRPELVCQIRFTEWTDDGGLRHPVFLGLRDDKIATDVVREQPASVESGS